MLNEVFMPKLGMTMETGTIIQWFKNPGDPVKQGDILLEVMTDKINIEVEAYHSGVLLKRYFEADAVVPVNHVIGYIGDPGDTAPDTPPDISGGEASSSNEGEAQGASSDQASAAEPENLPNAATSGEKPRATPAARKAARDRHVALQQVKGSGEHGRIHRADVESYVAAAQKQAAAAVRATPLARKIASDHGVDLAPIEGSGERGKVLRSDVERALAAAKNQPSRDKRVIKMQGMRKIIAQRMSQSAYTAPHVTITTTVDMTAAKALRAELLPVIEKQTGLRLSFTEMMLKAVAACLMKHPTLNARWENDEVVLQDDANIGLAVSVKDGLLVPVLFGTQRMGLAELVMKSKELAGKARENRLKPEDLSGGSFTVSNLGMYAVDSFTPIINQPEVAILGIGQIQEKPAVIGGELKVRPMMTLSLSFDHRVVDGAPAAAFLTDLKQVLEQPYQLLI
ncbi:dihydrolipoamide acetyltransferase family protein [Paenibacillus ginsengihumi]|uniref:dihydrolipoamide acetyltransferase family protein n=1 Tax=Paenibacillus ginsengihumi TaxID=431596 RepID=UPI00037045F2|nr:dihydrolipoamide acetyltransferase family protein [Paenibacillus ginsengihumi]